MTDMALKKSVRVTKRGVKTRKSKPRSSSKSSKKRAKNKEVDSYDISLSRRVRQKKTWFVILGALVIALAFQQFQLVSLVVQEDVLPQCTLHEHCSLGKHCIFSRCYAHTPDYPEIGRVKIFTGYGKEVIPNNQGYYEVEPDELMFLEVQADNDKDPFQIHTYSQVGLGKLGLQKNQQQYFAVIQEGDPEHKNLYWVQIQDNNKDNFYRFYFDLVGFKGEKYNMFVFLKNSSEYAQRSSEIVEIPIQIV